MDIVFFVHVFHCACNENHNGKKPLTRLYNDRSQDGKTIVSFGVALGGVAVIKYRISDLVLHGTFSFKNRVVSYWREDH